MTETINKETVAGEPGAVEEPTQPASEPQAAPSAVDEASLKAILEPMIEDAFSRQAQSVKDKRFAKQESRISSIEDTLAQLKELKADGMSEKQAIQYMETQEFLKSQGQIPTEAPPAEEPAVQPEVATDALLSSVLEMAGLKDSDPDVITLLREERDPAKQIIAIGTLAETRKQAKQSPPSPGAALSSGGGKAVVSEDMDSLSERLTELHSLEVQTPESRLERKEIAKKLDKLQPIK